MLEACDRLFHNDRLSCDTHCRQAKGSHTSRVQGAGHQLSLGVLLVCRVALRFFKAEQRHLVVTRQNCRLPFPCSARVSAALEAAE